jgi:hypothetical protein
VRFGAMVTDRGAVSEPPASAPLGAGVATAACILALGALWELIEWAADSWFGTHYSQGYQDTLGDLLADTAAASAGGALVGRDLPRFRGQVTARRLPPSSPFPRSIARSCR